MPRRIAAAALVSVLAVAGCGDGDDDSTERRARTPGNAEGGERSTLPPGCRPSQVRSLLTGFAKAIDSANRAAVSRYIAPAPKLIGFTIYVDGVSDSSPFRGRAPAAISDRLIRLAASQGFRLLGAQVGPNAPFAADRRYAVAEKLAAGADLVFAADGRAISGKVGIDCRTGRLYLAAMSVRRGIRKQQMCGRRIRLDVTSPVVCAY